MLCKERERLVNIYLAAVAQDHDVGVVISGDDGDGMTGNTPVDPEKALLAIYDHQMEHGC